MQMAATNAEQTPAPRVFAWGLVAAVGQALATSLLSGNGLAGVALGAAVVEWASGRAGVLWSDAESREARLRQRLWPLGAGALLAIAVLCVAVAPFGLRIRAGSPAPLDLLLASASVVLVAVRDELLVHGLVVRLVPSLPGPMLVGLGGGASVAVAVGAGRPVAELAVVFVFGMVAMGFWLRSGTALPPVLFASGYQLVALHTVGAGALALDPPPGWLSGGPFLFSRSGAALLVLGLAAAWTLRASAMQRARSKDPGGGA